MLYFFGSAAAVITGYDCPHGALTFNTSYYTDNTFAVNTDAVCIFEVRPGPGLA